MGEGAVRVNGIDIRYDDLGNPADPSVVLIMGANATALAWRPSFYEPIVEAGFHVVRFDNRDVGRSQWIDYSVAPYTLDDMAADTVGLMDALSIERAHVIGVSMGGMIAQLVALNWREHVLTLTTISSSPGVTDPDLPPMSTEILELTMTPIPDSRVDRVDHLVEFYRALAGSRTPFDEPRWRAVFEAEMDRGFNPHSGHIAAALSSPSRRKALAELDLPVLVIHGDEDPLVPHQHGRATAAAIPDATFLTVPGAGHIDVVDHLSEVLPPLLDHLARAP